MAGKWKGNGGSGVVLSTSVSASQSFHSFEERAAVCACLYMPGCPVCIVKLLRII